MSTSLPSPWPRLVADVGGTHLRVAWQPAAQAPLQDLRVMRCADHAGVEAAIRFYLEQVGAPAPRLVGLGIANPVEGDRVRMTNRNWSFSQADLVRSLGLEHLLVINDFTALALSLPLLEPRQLRQVGGGVPVTSAPVGLLGPGTGLGVSGLVFPMGPKPGEIVALASEGGHATLAAQTPFEFAVLQQLQQRYAHVSAERVLSGPGLVALYQAVCSLSTTACSSKRERPSVIDAAEVTSLALHEGDPLACQALEMFCAFLGNVAGNLALTLGARGGIYLGGGIVSRLVPWFDTSPFRRQFEAKGRFQAYLAKIPCWIIDPEDAPALLGIATALSQLT